MKTEISAVILTKDEEKNIGKCVKSLDFCGEILIIDDNSSDRTVKIAGELGARVIKRSLNGNFADQRNYAFRQSRGQWTLFIDADESVTPQLKNEIIQITGNPLLRYSGLCLKRQDVVWGRKIKHGENGNKKLLRVVKKGSGIWKRRVHEFFESEGIVGMCKSPLLHFPHQSIKEFIGHINFQSSLHARANMENKKRASLIKITFWPLFKFVNNWVFKLGFLDGTAGFVSALLMGFHSYLSWSKLWILQRGDFKK